MSRIKTKFIEDNAVTDLKMRLRNNLAFRARNAGDTADIEILKVSNTDILTILREMSMDSNKITNLADPTNAVDAANKQYVDSVVSGLVSLIYDQYVPFGSLQISGFKGIKGQWSYNDERYYICISNDTWIYLPTENLVNRVIEERFNQFQEQYVPYGQLVSSSFKGIKGQWSYSLDYFYLCIATDTWKVIGDINYVDSEDLNTRIGAGLESDGSYLADETTNYITQATSLKNADFKLDEKIKNLDDNFNLYVNLIDDQYVSFGSLQISGFKGVKGQWSYNDNRYYKCIATDTWFVTSNENLVDEKISDLLKQFVNQYVPCCLVLNNSATGIKGQWSFQVGHSSHKGYVKVCIATNTWVRFEVDTLF